MSQFACIGCGGGINTAVCYTMSRTDYTCSMICVSNRFAREAVDEYFVRAEFQVRVE